jgi:septum formation protein
MPPRHLILASASAARRAILRRAGVRIVVRPADVRELRGRGRTLRETVLENARRKCAAVAGERVLAADTMVAYRGRLYGKPASRRAAVDLLSRLAGKTHVIATGVAFRDGGRVIERYVETKVTLRSLDRASIARLLSTYDPTRFAGGYVIKPNDPLIGRIEGSFTNVQGLPVEAVLPLITSGASRATRAKPRATRP